MIVAILESRVYTHNTVYLVYSIDNIIEYVFGDRHGLFRMANAM